MNTNEILETVNLLKYFIMDPFIYNSKSKSIDQINLRDIIDIYTEEIYESKLITYYNIYCIDNGLDKEKFIEIMEHFQDYIDDYVTNMVNYTNSYNYILDEASTYPVLIYINCNSHSMSLFIEKIDDDKFITTFFNSGLGSGYHPKLDRLMNNKFPKILGYLRHKRPIRFEKLKKVIEMINSISNKNKIDDFYGIVINYLFINEDQEIYINPEIANLETIEMDVQNDYINPITHNIITDNYILYVQQQIDNDCTTRCVIYQFLTFLMFRRYDIGEL